MSSYTIDPRIDTEKAAAATTDITRIQKNQKLWEEKCAREKKEAEALSRGMMTILKAAAPHTISKPCESYTILVETPELIKLLKSKAYRLYSFSFMLTDSADYTTHYYQVVSVKWKAFRTKAKVTLEDKRRKK